jgi:hypothetical protein
MSESTVPTEDLEKRIAELENYVKEIGNVLYEVIQELQNNGQAMAMEPICPPICPR